MSTYPRANWTSLTLDEFRGLVLEHIESLVQESRDTDFYNGSHVKSWASSTQGRRQHMEDAAVLGENMCAITDGHGGRDAMVAASHHLKELDAPNILIGGERKRVASALSLLSNNRDYTRNLVEARTLVEQLELAVEAARANDGCTLALVTRDPIERHVVTVTTLGDSRVIIISKRDGVETMQVHEDHNTNNRREVERVQQYAPLSKQRLDGSLMLTRSLGDLRYVKFGLSHIPDISVIALDADDVVVIGSDGLFETLSNDQIAVALRVILEHAPQENAARTLVHLASETGSADNITAIVWDVMG